jgi:hypothetical protein
VATRNLRREAGSRAALVSSVVDRHDPPIDGPPFSRGRVVDPSGLREMVRFGEGLQDRGKLLETAPLMRAPSPARIEVREIRFFDAT